MTAPRFEEQVWISLMCWCDGAHVAMVLKGNLSLREAASREDKKNDRARTRLAYECPRCFRRVSVCDDWGEAAPAWVHELEE